MLNQITKETEIVRHILLAIYLLKKNIFCLLLNCLFILILDIGIYLFTSFQKMNALIRDLLLLYLLMIILFYNLYSWRSLYLQSHFAK
jgi:hypothetical protein